MSDYYNPRRSRNMYDPRQTEPFRLSRSKVDLFINCPRCFYLDRRLGTDRPPGYPFSLNSAVDALLKKEFDVHRKNKTPHPLMKKFKIDAVPYAHPDMDIWRDTRKGITYKMPKTNLLITGAVDDVWINPLKQLYIVDYKATAKQDEVTLDADWQEGYKRQLEIYQWLFRRNGFNVDPHGYFVYCNGDAGADGFTEGKDGSRGCLNFRIKIIPYKGDDSWVSEVVMRAYKCLQSDKLPIACSDCDYCKYREAVTELEGELTKK